MKRKINWVLTLLFALSVVAIEAQTNYQVISDANFRKGPGTRFKSINIIKSGEKVYVYDTTNPSWFKVEYNGKFGHMSSKSLFRLSTPSIIETIPAATKTEPKKSNDDLFWGIGVLLFIALLIYARKKRKKSSSIQSVTHPSIQAKSVRTQENVSTKDPFKNKAKTIPIASIQEKQNKLSTTDTKDLSTNTQIRLGVESDSQSKEAVKSNTTNDQIKPVVTIQEEKSDPSIIEVTSLGYSVKINVVAGQDYRPKVPAINSQTNEAKPYSTNYTYADSVNEGNYWGLGTKYQTKLHLTDEQVDILNKQWAASNNFCSIDSCCEEVVKFFVSSLKSLDEAFIKENTTLNKQITAVVDTVLRKHFRYQLNSFNYKSSIESTSTEIYTTLFKCCENTVRNYYGHKRKLNTETYFASTSTAQTEFESRIITPLNKLLPSLISAIVPPDEETEILLNAQNTSRWKDKFEEIKENYKDNYSVFFDDIIKLGVLNKKNPSIENIFFEASKFIAKSDKETALTLYVHYLYHDLKSATFDNKQLTKTIQKNIFKTNDELKAFEILLSNLIQDKNLKKALKGIPAIFAIKRKKITLNTESIKEVQLQHSETVELLNEYLKEEYEDENNSIKTQETSNEELMIQITPKSQVEQVSIYTKEIVFSPTQVEVLDIFSKSNFSVVKKELETIIKPKGFFVNQVIENINEVSYDYLDDILIEEEDDHLTINPDYYQRILAK